MDTRAFHYETATRLAQLYTDNPQAPDGWQEIVAWHWEQAEVYDKSLEAALQVTETYVRKLTFGKVRYWSERVLTVLDRIPQTDRYVYELRAYALIIFVLEFGGQYREALVYAKTLQRRAVDSGNIDAQCRSFLIIGRAHRALGQFVLAEADLVGALTLAQKHNLFSLEAEIQLQLAKVHQLQGKHLKAFQHLEMAQEVPLNDRAWIARVATNLGDIYRVLGASREALEFYHRALKLEIGSGNWLGQAMLYEKIGLAKLGVAQPDEALACIQKSLRLRDTFDDTVGQARSHTILGQLQLYMKNNALALEHFKHAYALESLSQNQIGLIMLLTNMGDTAYALRENEQARNYYREALDLAHNINDQIALSRLHQRLGDLYRDEGVLETARNHWTTALHIRESLGHSEEAIMLRKRLEVVRVRS